MLLEEHKAFGAYDLLQRLAHEGDSAQPTIVYRALDFLRTHGFVHKVERLNAFVACAHPLESHAPTFLICRACESVAETSSELSGSVLGKAAREASFKIEHAVVEAVGLCPDCIAADTSRR